MKTRKNKNDKDKCWKSPVIPLFEHNYRLNFYIKIYLYLLNFSAVWKENCSSSPHPHQSEGQVGCWLNGPWFRSCAAAVGGLGWEPRDCMVGFGQGFSALLLWMFGPRIFGCGVSCESRVCSILSRLHYWVVFTSLPTPVVTVSSTSRYCLCLGTTAWGSG